MSVNDRWSIVRKNYPESDFTINDKQQQRFLVHTAK
jgi:hypothetical protein